MSRGRPMIEMGDIAPLDHVNRGSAMPVFVGRDPVVNVSVGE